MTTYQHSTFIWHELHSDDVKKSLDYYVEVLGFEVTEMNMAGAPEPYRMLSTGGEHQFGVVPSEGPAPMFHQYLSVADVDAAAKKVESLGGKIVVPPMEIPVGKFAFVSDPQGAVFALFKGVEDDKRASSFHWNELWSKDASESVAFYEKAFGLTSEKMEMPDADPERPYFLLKEGETMVGGIMTSPAKEIPPMWLPYIAVEDVDETIKRASARGGELQGPMMNVPPVGKFGVVKEPGGAVVGLITPAKRD